MTDRVHALTVVLAEDRRDDDVAPLIAAILQLRGVLDVRSHVTDIVLHVAAERARAEIEQRLWDALRSPP